MEIKKAIKFLNGNLEHWSDCAVYNEPAYRNGKCNCGFEKNIQGVIKLLSDNNV